MKNTRGFWTRKNVLSIILIIAVLVAFGVTGCGREDGKELIRETVFTFDGEKIALGEVYLYANMVIDDYVATYGSDIWTMNTERSDGTVVDMETITREDIISDIIHVKLLCNAADEYKVSLSENERAKVKEDAEEFYARLTDEQIDTMQIDLQLVEDVLLENALAKKVRQVAITDGNIEVSDEDSRMVTIYDMFFECYKLDSNGNVVELDEEEKNNQYERAVQAYSTLINPISEGDKVNVEGLAEYYNLTHSAYYTMSPEEMKDVYGDEIAENILTLADGSYSLVTETEYGYHIFYMKASVDKDATKENKQKMTDKLVREYMDAKYDKWMSKKDKKFSYPESVDMQVYEKIIFE